MGLLSIFKRGTGTAPNVPASEPVDAVQRARVQARQRLIGAVVLVIAGIIGFPLVFETQPRPIPVDIPIEIPRKESAPPLAMPPPPTPTSATGPRGSSTAAGPGTPAANSSDMITESREDAGRDVTPAGQSAARADANAASRPAANARADVYEPARPASRTAVAGTTNELRAKTPPPVRAATDADAERARELLEGKPEGKATVASTAPANSAPGAARFVLQVGAFADAAAARETRAKAEKLGLKTYTQMASTAAGGRIRVRIGPFGSRDEADKALARARSAGLAGVVLTL